MSQKRERLQRVRKRAGFTQEELAYRLEADRSTVGRWEAGETTPHPWQQPRLAKLLGVTRAELDSLLNAEQPDTTGNELHRLSPGAEACIEDDMNRRNLLRALGLDAASLSPLSDTRDVVIDAAHTSALLSTSVETYGISRRVLSHARGELAKLATDYALTSDLEPILQELVVLRNHLAAVATTRHHPTESRDLYQLLEGVLKLRSPVPGARQPT